MLSAKTELVLWITALIQRQDLVSRTLRAAPPAWSELHLYHFPSLSLHTKEAWEGWDLFNFPLFDPVLKKLWARWGLSTWDRAWEESSSFMRFDGSEKDPSRTLVNWDDIAIDAFNWSTFHVPVAVLNAPFFVCSIRQEPYSTHTFKGQNKKSWTEA